METTEKIVEAYVRHIKKWATISNIKCSGQYEIDLLAVDPRNRRRYHIESGVSISGGFSKLTTKPYSNERLKMRTKQAEQRRTLWYFLQRKFSAPGIREKLRDYGFTEGNYSKVIVTWAATDDAKRKARVRGIELWYFPEMIAEIADTFQNQRTYFSDDTLRTLHLYARARKETGA